MLTTAELVWLLAGSAHGDQTAFERLYAATRAKLYGILLPILRRSDLAGDVLQESYLQIWTRAAQFDPATTSPLVWMVAIARQRALDARRRQDGVVADEPVAADAAEEAGEPTPRVLPDDLKRLLACVGHLDPDCQRMLLHAYYNGASRDELAREYERPVETVREQLRQALQAIREGLGP